jgi:hypothetical protein
VEPAGIEPATSCLQSVQEDRSHVAARCHRPKFLGFRAVGPLAVCHCWPQVLVPCLFPRAQGRPDRVKTRCSQSVKSTGGAGESRPLGAPRSIPKEHSGVEAAGAGQRRGGTTRPAGRSSQSERALSTGQAPSPRGKRSEATDAAIKSRKHASPARLARDCLIFVTAAALPNGACLLRRHESGERYAKRCTNASDRSATSRQPLSMVSAWPRLGTEVISVTDGLWRCFLNEWLAIAHGIV